MNIKAFVKKFARPLPVVEEIRREAKEKGLDRLTRRDINQEIKKARLELRIRQQKD